MSARPEALPPNPYTRKPIKVRRLLAGRSKELEEIEYFLNLTQAGQSQHIALIGDRGVGKTSLLLSSASIAKEHKLLTVSIDLNDAKTTCPGVFWQDFYSALALGAAEAGCWGGIHGPIYAALSTMIDAREPADGSLCVLLFPRALAGHKGSVENLFCSDSLIGRDLQATLDELQRLGLCGAVFLIDEADCLGSDAALLQMVRNIFQKLDGCSLMLAGTEGVFPAIYDVFPPIPRQFHRIDVEPFQRLAGTADLVQRPIAKELRRVLPSIDTLSQLHELCGGDPAELQLYCFHMYKQVEEGRSEEMDLTPDVFKAVMHEYRVTTPEHIELVIKEIERLPQDFFVQHPWLQYRGLSSQEIRTFWCMWEELQDGQLLPSHRRVELESQISESFCHLFEKGISTDKDSLRFPGGVLISGFWKSFAEAERHERWHWSDQGFSEALAKRTVALVAEQTEAFDFSYEALEPLAEEILASLPERMAEHRRSGEEGRDTVGSISFEEHFILLDLFAAIATALLEERKQILQVPIVIKFMGETVTAVLRYLHYENSSSKVLAIQEFIDSRKLILERHDIGITILEAREWAVPSPELFGLLQEVVGIRSGILQILDCRLAMRSFAAGDVLATANAFERLLAVDRAHAFLNNLAFCKILLGDHQPAEDLLKEAIELEASPLYLHNLGVLACIRGDREAGAQLLAQARSSLAGSEEQDRPSYMLVLNPGGQEITVIEQIPVEVGTLLSLLRLGYLQSQEVADIVHARFASESEKWLSHIKPTAG